MPLPPGMMPKATSGCANQARPIAAKRMSRESRNSLPPPRARPETIPIVATGMLRKRSTIRWNAESSGDFGGTSVGSVWIIDTSAWAMK